MEAAGRSRLPPRTDVARKRRPRGMPAKAARFRLAPFGADAGFRSRRRSERRVRPRRRRLLHCRAALEIPGRAPMTALLSKRVLVIEDEAIIAAMVEEMLTELGAIVIGPAATIAHGLELAMREAIDGALLDVNVRSERIDPVADVLRSRDIPYVYATGYGGTAAMIANGAPVIEKPYTLERLAHTMLAAMSRPGGGASAG